MPQQPSIEEIAQWHRWFAVESNNRAWDLAEKPDRTPAESEELLHAAHAAVLHWSKIGTELNKARAEMILGQAHALCGNGSLALTFAQRSYDYVISHDSPDWEVALAHAILANAAFAAQNLALYAKHYALAKTTGDAIAEDNDKQVFLRTFKQLPIAAT